MSLTAFAQTPDSTEASRKATADRLTMGEKTWRWLRPLPGRPVLSGACSRNLSGARLRQANLSLSTFDNSNFAGANMPVVNAFGIRAEDADFSGVNFEDAVLVGGSFNGAKFGGASLANANLSGSDFSTATGLTQAQLNAACGDTETKLPKGLVIAACAKS